MGSGRYGLDDDCALLPHLDTPGVCNRCGTSLKGRQTQWCSDECQEELRRNHDWGVARRAALVRDGHRCVRCSGTGNRRQWVTLWAHDRRHRAQLIDLGIDPDGIRGGRIQVAKALPWLEVNHIKPRNGGGYGWGCAHHQSNLETLCHPCHVAETNRQASERRDAAAPPTLLELLNG